MLSPSAHRPVDSYRHRFLAAATLCAVALLAKPGHAADAPAPNELQLTTQRAIVFKDGYYLVIKHGSVVTDKSGDVYCDDVPDAAVLGSFWATADKGTLESMTAGWETVHKTVEKELHCVQPLEILKANVGKSARVELFDKTVYKGQIHQVLTEELKSDLPESLRLAFGLPPVGGDAAMSTPFAGRRSPRPRDTLTATVTTMSGTQCILRTEEGDVLVPVGQIKTVIAKDLRTTLKRTVTTTEKTKRLTFRFAEKNQRQNLTLMYFRPGLRWIPSYRIELVPDQEKKLASLNLQAEFINEAEDLTNVPLDIVVGVANFRFQNVPSPLILEQVLRNSLAEAAPQLLNQRSNQLFNNNYAPASYGNSGVQPDAGGDLRLPSELTSAARQDLFVYSLPKVTLAKGQRAALPIFATKVPYRDVYTWDVHVTRSDVELASSSKARMGSAQRLSSGSHVASPLNLSQNNVWHQIVLKNTTKLPWTTGAALLMQGHQPVAQEMLTYTSPTDEVRVPITVAVDVRGTYEEKETGRKLNDLAWDGYNYARIDKQGALNICNHKQEPIDIEITYHVGGKAETVSHDGTFTLGAFDGSDWTNYRGSPAVNNSSTVVWKTKLAPGKTFEPTVTYSFFTRH